MFAIARAFIVTLLAALAIGCAAEPVRAPAPPPLRHVVLITVDTLRADRVGAFGGTARTPAMDALARDGTRFDRAYATAPITLPSHASLMTGRYPPGHGGRHNGMRIDLKVPTLAEAFARAGFATGGFVAAFPLDRRFGLIKGFNCLFNPRVPHVFLNPLYQDIPELDPTKGGTLIGSSRDYVDPEKKDELDLIESRLRSLGLKD